MTPETNPVITRMTPSKSEIEAELEKISESDFIKEPVIGYLVSEVPYYKPDSHNRGFITNRGGRGFITISDLAVATIAGRDTWLDLSSDNEIQHEEKLIGVIPAPVGTYKILGLFMTNEKGDGEYRVIGYEFPGVDHEPWELVLAGERVAERNRK